MHRKWWYRMAGICHFRDQLVAHVLENTLSWVKLEGEGRGSSITVRYNELYQMRGYPRFWRHWPGGLSWINPYGNRTLVVGRDFLGCWPSMVSSRYRRWKTPWWGRRAWISGVPGGEWGRPRFPQGELELFWGVSGKKVGGERTVECGSINEHKVAPVMSSFTLKMSSRSSTSKIWLGWKWSSKF